MLLKKVINFIIINLKDLEYKNGSLKNNNKENIPPN